LANQPTPSAGKRSAGKPAPRRAALDALVRLDKGPVDLQAALDGAFTPAWLPRDRRLATELTFGTARWRYRIDPVIKSLTGRRVKDLDRPTRALLRLGVYQLMFMDRTPAPVAVSETVALSAPGRRRGFVNGVLRKAASGEWPPLPADPTAHFAAEYSLPPWLAQRWLQRYSPEVAQDRAEQVNRTAPLTLRVNTERTSREALLAQLREAGYKVREGLHSPNALSLKGAVRDLPGYHDGHFYVQDEASQWVADLLAAQPGERVLDACAAPGGKATQLASQVGADGRVVALERDDGRMKRLRDNIARLGLQNIQVIQGDATQVSADDLGGMFDRVLLDAPCSGLGVLNRHPEGKWWKSAEAVGQCAVEQAAMLAHLSTMVKPGGHLLYAVCSGEQEETVAVVDAFLAANPEYSLLAADQVLGDAASGWQTQNGCLDTSGNRVGMDGFFAAHLLRKS